MDATASSILPELSTIPLQAPRPAAMAEAHSLETAESARLKVSRPDDYARMMRIIAGVTRHPELDVARWISATFDAANVSYLPLWMTSLPPKRRLSLCLASTDYTVVLTITQDGARVSPALSAPPHLH